MLQLLVDTATEKGFVGLAKDGKVIEWSCLPVGFQNSKQLFPALLALLDRNHLVPKDIDLIGCGVGPGSYTGIRVGAALAQGMAYALNIPLVGISSLRAYVPSKPGAFASVFDARHGGLYVLKGQFDGKVSCFEEMPYMANGEDLKEMAVIITPHGELKKMLPQIEEANPSKDAFALQVDQEYRAGHYSKKAELKLLYLKQTQAEMEKSLG